MGSDFNSEPFFCFSGTWVLHTLQLLIVKHVFFKSF